MTLVPNLTRITNVEVPHHDVIRVREGLPRDVLLNRCATQPWDEQDALPVQLDLSWDRNDADVVQVKDVEGGYDRVVFLVEVVVSQR